ncbi:hypothetical protein [Desertimonas flava]|uniref:hypothetical protein n=1 Tax=Desertimonas flava TaxID=2064846 RepID=UPI000E34630F|nr:hypothetical protein [Desertimonas flava]
MVDDVRLDRATARRVFQRASAADGPDRRDGASTDVDRLDDETVVAAAVEAGIDPAEVRRALAFERLGPEPARGRGAGLLGGADVSADAEIAGHPDVVMARLDSWLVGGHHLRRDRLRDGRGVWRRRTGVLGATFRTVRRATGEGRLGDLARIEAIAVDTGVGTSVVRVTADRRRDRLVRASAGAAAATVGTAVVAVVAAVSVPAVLLATPVALGVGTGIAATGRRAATDVAVELERVLDAVDHGDTPARLGPDVVRRVIGRRGRPSSPVPPPPPT